MPNWEALTPETQQAFRKVAGLEFVNGIYLAGGTGRALHLGHRFSIDRVSVASLEEIGAMKMAAIINRGTQKDLAGLYFILHKLPTRTGWRQSPASSHSGGGYLISGKK